MMAAQDTVGDGTIVIRLTRLRITIVALLLLAAAIFVGSSMIRRQVREQDPSDQRLLELLQRREHTWASTWKGDLKRTVDATGHGASGRHALDFTGATSHILNKAIDRARSNPLLFLPLLDSRDSDVVLTAMKLTQSPGNLYYANQPRAAGDLCQALRDKALQHTDARVRWLAVQIIYEHGLFEPQDVDLAFSDTCAAVRDKATLAVSTVMARLSRQRQPAELQDQHAKPVPTYDADNSLKRRLVEVLLKHLNHHDFLIRDAAARNLRQLLQRNMPAAGGGTVQTNPPGMPDRIDFVRTDWKTRDATHKAWLNWWQTNADSAIAFSDHTKKPLPQTRPSP